VTNFWVKSSIILWKLGQVFFFFKNKIIFNFVKFVAQKICFHPSLLLRFLDTDPGSGVGKKSGSGIRDKHPGSATLVEIHGKREMGG
jgi:hypothetical protein